MNFDPHGTRPLRVTLTIHGRAAGGTILRLTAPAALATTGVKLGGEEVAASGRWHPKLPLPASITTAVARSVLSMPAAQRGAGHDPAPAASPATGDGKCGAAPAERPIAHRGGSRAGRKSGEERPIGPPCGVPGRLGELSDDSR